MASKERKDRTQIMFVDDEPGVRRAFARAMRPSGLDVHLADGASTALELARGHDFPVVVTDLRMPEVDGMALIEKLEQVTPRTTYVILTGAPEMLPKEISDERITEVVEKPWDKERLASAIDRALAQHRGHNTYREASNRPAADDAGDED